MSKGNGNKGRIITGPGGGDDREQEQELEFRIPALNQYWVIWFNPESERVEHVSVAAHTVDVHDDGMLVFKAFVKNEDPVQMAMGAPPMSGYYVGSFRNHIRFGQQPPVTTTEGQVH